MIGSTGRTERIRRATRRCMLALVWMASPLSLFGNAEAQVHRPPGAPSMAIGAYVWDALPDEIAGGRDRRLSTAVRILAGAGLRAVRFVVNSQQLKTYHIDQGVCARPVRARCYLTSADFRSALADPDMDIVALTVHEISLSNWRMADLDAVRANAAESRAELRALLEDIAPILKENPRKTLIITNREGDHSIYCGSTAKFIGNAERRRDCLGEMNGQESPAVKSRLEALIRWYQTRQEEIEAFRKKNGLEGQLLHAIEFNVVDRIRDFSTRMDARLPDTLRDIVPAVKPDLCSYSSYSSFNNGYSFKNDLETIKQYCGGSGIIIGELGFSSGKRNDDQIARSYANALRIAQAAGVRAVFLWQGFESDAAGKRYGLFTRAGEPLQWTSIQASVHELQGRAPAQ